MVVVLLQVLLEVVAPEGQQGFLHFRVELQQQAGKLSVASSSWAVLQTGRAAFRVDLRNKMGIQMFEFVLH